MIAALLVTMLLAQPAPDTARSDRQWVCSADARGSRGARVDVSIQLTTGGDILSRDVNWSPPTPVRAALSRPDVKAPGLTLYYEDAEAEGIGEVTDALGNISSTSAPAGTLDDMALAVRIDGDAAWHVELEAMPGASAPETGAPTFDYRSGWLADGDTDIDPIERLRSARTVTLSLVNRAGHPVSQVGYDLSATAERDRLFRQAWAKADKLALRPARCTAVGG